MSPSPSAPEASQPRVALLSRVESFFVEHGFAALALALLLFFALLLGALLVIPAGAGLAGVVAEQVRLWCFSTDPVTGVTPVKLVLASYVELGVLGAIIAWIWRRQLEAEARRGGRGFVRPVLAGLGLAAFGAGVFVVLALSGPARVDPSRFPATGLRVSVPAPSFALIDHQSERVSLAELRGRVVMLTGIYATCGLACPSILGQAKRAVASLDAAAQEDVTVLGVTLDPERDDAKQLHQMAEAQKVHAPRFRLLTGGANEVNALLDRLDISRRRDPDTGLIDHANVFILVDRQGRIAYRLGMGEQQERWLGEGLRVLLAEPAAVTAATP